jgi:hypothetical protein
MTKRELERIESLCKSPIINYYNETIEGTSTIRAFRKVEDFHSKQCFLQDRHLVANLMNKGLACWFEIRLVLICVAYLGFALIYTVSYTFIYTK